MIRIQVYTHRAFVYYPSSWRRRFAFLCWYTMSKNLNFWAFNVEAKVYIQVHWKGDLLIGQKSRSQLRRSNTFYKDINSRLKRHQIMYLKCFGCLTKCYFSVTGLLLFFACSFYLSRSFWLSARLVKFTNHKNGLRLCKTVLNHLIPCFRRTKMV